MSKIAIFWVNYLLPRELSGAGKLYFSKVDLIMFPTHQKSFPKINCFRIFSSLKTSCNCASILIIHIVTLWGKWYGKSLGFATHQPDMTDFYAKMAGKDRFYTFDLHLKDWNPYPWNIFREKPFSRSHPLVWPYSKIPKFTFSRKYLICGFNVEISEYP